MGNLILRLFTASYSDRHGRPRRDPARRRRLPSCCVADRRSFRRRRRLDRVVRRRGQSVRRRLRPNCWTLTGGDGVAGGDDDGVVGGDGRVPLRRRRLVQEDDHRRCGDQLAVPNALVAAGPSSTESCPDSEIVRRRILGWQAAAEGGPFRRY